MLAVSGDQNKDRTVIYEVQLNVDAEFTNWMGNIDRKKLLRSIFNQVESGELDKDLDPQTTAAILVAYMQGVLRLSCLNFDAKKIKSQTEHFLKSIGI